MAFRILSKIFTNKDMPNGLKVSCARVKTLDLTKGTVENFKKAHENRLNNQNKIYID